jgi:flagellar biosynthesis protein FlhF
MNVKRFLARTSRDALSLVRHAFGEDAVVLSTKPHDEGVEVLAMGPDSIQHLESVSASAPTTTAGPTPARARAKPSAGSAPSSEDDVASDAERLSMSTLSFQDYVRNRMLKRRQAALRGPQAHADEGDAVAPSPAAPVARLAPPVPREPIAFSDDSPPPVDAHRSGAARHEHDAAPHRRDAEAASARREAEVMNELRSMKGLIEDRFGALAFMDKLQRQPAQARLTQKLLECSFSPALIRKLVEGMDAGITDELAWATGVLECNLLTNEHDGALEDRGGVYALIGATGVGKTTSVAKIAAAFATKHGASNLGLITLDAYRVGAHEQLRAYGRILGVPVHTAHDRASLEDLLELLSAKKMVLIDTAGFGQRDSRTRELLDMLAHRSINKLLVINAATQGETIEDVMLAYRASVAAGVVVSKMDEAMRLGPVLDAVIRHRLKVVGVANGQRVPEDWHRLSSKALVHRALRASGGGAYRLDAGDVSLMFTGRRDPAVTAAASMASAA